MLDLGLDKLKSKHPLGAEILLPSTYPIDVTINGERFLRSGYIETDTSKFDRSVFPDTLPKYKEAIISYSWDGTTTVRADRLKYEGGLYFMISGTAFPGIAVSQDGINYIQCRHPFNSYINSNGIVSVQSSISIIDVSYNPVLGVYVCVGASGLTAWSTDGLNWTMVAISGAGTLTSVSFTSKTNKFVVFESNSAGAVVWTSTDGKSWAKIAQGLTFTTSDRQFTMDSGRIVVTANGGISGVCTSDDGGATWNRRTTVGGTGKVYGLAVNGNVAMCGGSVGADGPSRFPDVWKRSIDGGTTWTSMPTIPAPWVDIGIASGVEDIYYDASTNKWYAFGNPGWIMESSDDGASWSVVQTKGLLCGVVTDEYIITGGSTALHVRSKSDPTEIVDTKSICSYFGAMFSIGSDPNGNVLAGAGGFAAFYSTDGETFTYRGISGKSNYGANTGYLNSLSTGAYNSGSWVLAGHSGEIATSTDGITFTVRTLPAGGSATVLDALCFSQAMGNKLITGGWSSQVNASNLYYSSDAGATWAAGPTGVYPSNFIFRLLAGDGNLVMACGTKGILGVTNDPTKMTAIETGETDESVALVFARNTYYRAGNNKILASKEGRYWYPCNIPRINSRLIASCVDNDGNIYFAGSNNTILRSTDGLNFHLLPGLPVPPINIGSMCYDQVRNRIYLTAHTASFLGGRIFYFDLADGTPYAGNPAVNVDSTGMYSYVRIS